MFEADDIPISIQGNWFSPEYKFYAFALWTGSLHEIDGRKFPLQVGITGQCMLINYSTNFQSDESRRFHGSILDREGKQLRAVDSPISR